MKDNLREKTIVVHMKNKKLEETVMKFSNELLEKAKTAKTAEELLAMAKAENIDMTAEEAAKALAELHKTGELSDEELDNVAGGCSPSGPPKYNVGDCVQYYYQYDVSLTGSITSTTCSFIEDIKADGSDWMYKLAGGSWDGAEYIDEDRIISLA